MTSCPGGGENVVDCEVDGAVVKLKSQSRIELVFVELGQVRQRDKAAFTDQFLKGPAL